MGNVWERAKLASQCKKTAIPMAVPRILKARTSGSIQFVGPQVAAKATMKPARQANTMIARGSMGFDRSGNNKEESPIAARLGTMPTNLARS
jgi:hypothetical protein